jgi:hypothetical protein
MMCGGDHGEFPYTRVSVHVPREGDVLGIDAEVGRREEVRFMIRDTGVVGLSTQGEWRHQKGRGRNREKMSGVHPKLP